MTEAKIAEPQITVTEAPAADDLAVINGGLRAYNTEQAGYDDYKPLAVFVTDPATGKVVGGLHGGSYLGQLRVDRFFLPEDHRRDRIGSRVLKLAEEEGRKRGCKRAVLYTISFQAPEFYKKYGWRVFGEIPCDPPGTSRIFMTKELPR